MITLAAPTSRRAAHRSGPGTRSLAPSASPAGRRVRVASSAYVFGTASASTKITIVSMMNDASTPAGPHRSDASTAMMRGGGEMAREQHEQDRVEHALAVLEQAHELFGPRLAVLGQRAPPGRVRDESARSRPPPAPPRSRPTPANASSPTTSRATSCHTHADEITAGGSARAVSAPWPAWPRPLRDRHDPCRARAGCRARRARRARRRTCRRAMGALAAATRWADHHVAQQQRGFLDFGAVAGGTGRTVVGPAAGADQVVLEREREHVGRRRPGP